MKYVALLLLLLVNSNSSFAIDPPANTLFAAKIVDLETGDILYENNADLPLIPASNHKIITTYAALNLLNPVSTFQTALYMHEGNVFVKFSGDPELSYKDLSTLFAKLKEYGVNTISGTVYIDDKDFDHEYFGQGWSYDQIKFCFSAPISAIMLDKNCELYKLKKDSTHYIPEKQPSFTTLKNQSKHTAKQEFCEFELNYRGNNEYELGGCYNKTELPSRLLIATRDPQKLGVDAIGAALKENNIKFGKIKFAALNSKAKLIASHESRPIKELLIDMMKDSDNQISETIFKLISKDKLNLGSWKNSATLVSEFIKSDLNITNFVIKDGSGESRKNLISPAMLVAILDKSKDNQDFLKTLPQSGMEGTLKNRFKTKPLFENIFAKTGTLDNVSSLSGYVYMDNGKKIAFSIIANNCVNDKNLKRFEEEFLYELLTEIN